MRLYIGATSIYYSLSLFSHKKTKIFNGFFSVGCVGFFYLFATTFTYLIFFFSPRRTWEMLGKFSQVNLIFIRTSRIVVTNREAKENSICTTFSFSSIYF